MSQAAAPPTPIAEPVVSVLPVYPHHVTNLPKVRRNLCHVHAMLKFQMLRFQVQLTNILLSVIVGFSTAAASLVEIGL